MIESDYRVEHLSLTHDGKCDKEGHELIPRACIHCGMTLHEISDANDNTVPLRDTPADRAETKRQTEKRLKRAQDAVVEIEQQLEAQAQWRGVGA
jgi:hypothetical protein